MLTILSDIELRVLGALIEKQVTTPEYYPLTLNALTLACNQKNNRYPITAYNDTAVAQALETLREKNLTYVFYGSSSRVPKYKHVMTEIFHLTQAELALMCVLMLRGPQTVGELHTRASRLYNFSNIEGVDETLNLLIRKDPEPLVVRLPRQAGQKEVRCAHLLSGEINFDQLAEADRLETARASGRPPSERVLKLEQEVEALRADVTTLQLQFEEFKKQFE
jgi:uncharacterized protein YceH (UPF0502 family)